MVKTTHVHSVAHSLSLSALWRALLDPTTTLTQHQHACAFFVDGMIFRNDRAVSELTTATDRPLKLLPCARTYVHVLKSHNVTTGCFGVIGCGGRPFHSDFLRVLIMLRPPASHFEPVVRTRRTMTAMHISYLLLRAAKPPAANSSCDSSVHSFILIPIPDSLRCLATFVVFSSSAPW